MIETRTGSIRDQVSPEEWETRVHLAACYRLLAHYGMSFMALNHVTVNVPGEEDNYLINPLGLLFEQVTASNLVKVDHNAKIVLHSGDGPKPINPAGFLIHGAIHSARPDAKCIIHIHTKAGMAVSVMKCGLLPLTQDGMRFHKRIAYHDFLGMPVDVPNENENLVKSLGKYNALIMHNHGLLTCGETIPEAFNLMYSLHLACETQVAAMAGGAELMLPSQTALDSAYRFWVNDRRRGILEWDAMLWQADQLDPSYRL